MAPHMDNNNRNETTALLSEDKLSLSRHKRTVKNASRQRKSVVLAACFLLQLVSNGIGFGLSVMYVEIMREFGATRSTAVLVQSMFMAITTAGGILWTPVIRKYGSGRCAFVGSVAACIGLFASSFATSVYMIIVLTGVFASMGMCVSYLSPFITVSALFREHAGVPLVFLTTGSSIGQFIFPFMYELFIEQYGWNGAFVLLGGLALQCAPAACVMYGARDYMSETGVSKNKQTGCSAICNCDWKVLASITVILLLGNCFLLSATGNIEAWFLVDIITLRGYERETGSLFVSLNGLFNFFGRSTGVLLRYKVRIPTIYHWIYCMPMIAISHALVLQLTTYWPMLFACVLYGYVYGIVSAQTPAIMLEVVGIERYMDGMAFVNVCYGCGNLFGGSIGGVIKDSYGTYAPLFYLAISVTIYITLTTLVMIVISRRRTRQPYQIVTEEESITISYKRLTREGGD